MKAEELGGEINEIKAVQTGTAKRRELILIAISESTGCPQVIRAAVRLARELHAPVKAVYVEHRRIESLSTEEQRSLTENLQLAKALGAGVTMAYGSDIIGQIIETANVTGATKLFIGLSGYSFTPGRESVGVQIKNRMPSLDIYVIPGSSGGRRTAGKLAINAAMREKTYRNTPPFIMFISMVGVLSLCTLIGVIADSFGIPYVNIVIIYLFGVLLLSMIDGNIIFIGTSSLSAVLLLNYFFVEPRYCFQYHEKSALPTFVMIFIMAFTLSFLMGRFRKELETNHKTTMRTDLLFDCSTLLLLAKTETEVERTITEQLTRLVRMSVVIYRRNAEHAEEIPGRPIFYPMPGVSESQLFPLNNEIDREAVKTVFETGARAGFGTKKVNGARNLPAGQIRRTGLCRSWPLPDGWEGDTGF